MAIPQLANITSPPYPTASCDPPARQPSHSPSKIWKYILKIYQYTITIWNSLFCKFNSLLKLVNNCSTISNLRFIMICFLIWIVLAMFHQSMDKCPVSMALDNVYGECIFMIIYMLLHYLYIIKFIIFSFSYFLKYIPY